MPMIDLRQLRYFIAVAEEGHVTRAAERLGMQQPPLSQQIRAMEAEIGVVLFHRLPRGMQLTESGQALLGDARSIIAQLERALETARRVARGETGRVAVGFTSSAAFHPFVLSAIRAFGEAAPDVSLLLEEGGTVELVEALRAERLDAAFVRAPAGEAAGIVIEPLLEEPMLAALPSQHHLARGRGGRPRDSIALADLAGETFILYRRPTGPGLYDAIIAACRAAGFSPRIGQEAPRMPSTLSLVAAGLGVSIIPASMRRLETEGIAYLGLTDAPQLVAPLHLAYRAGALSAATGRLIGQVRDMAAGRG
ncbi:LysR family transcriptional regulator [Phreatobacter stygius]|uniref:LysR family transcriptional regulator n=1 Tax=Phreatobacter stygius TaxID=1940610 RepID=A0A4D7BK26_9HYPH|nr:LysR family transcriptional regulator [Phreatobacter stygius]